MTPFVCYSFAMVRLYRSRGLCYITTLLPIQVGAILDRQILGWSFGHFIGLSLGRLVRRSVDRAVIRQFGSSVRYWNVRRSFERCLSVVRIVFGWSVVWSEGPSVDHVGAGRLIQLSCMCSVLVAVGRLVRWTISRLFAQFVYWPLRHSVRAGQTYLSCFINHPCFCCLQRRVIGAHVWSSRLVWNLRTLSFGRVSITTCSSSNGRWGGSAPFKA